MIEWWRKRQLESALIRRVAAEVKESYGGAALHQVRLKQIETAKSGDLNSNRLWSRVYVRLKSLSTDE
jgi:hypothetical protein